MFISAAAWEVLSVVGEILEGGCTTSADADAHADDAHADADTNADTDICSSSMATIEYRIPPPVVVL